MLAPSFILLKHRIPPQRSSRIVEWNAFQEPAYFAFALGMFFNFWGLYIVFFYITSFARQVTRLSQTSSINPLLIMNGVGIFARTVPNFLADRFTGPVNLLIRSTLMSSVLLLCWISITTEPSLYAFVVFYGTFYAAVQSLFPATLASLSPDMEKIGVQTGMVLSIVGFAALTGSPIAGALVSRGNGGYLYAQIFAGASMFIGTGILVVARGFKAGFKLRVKV
jgi:predicted MFS family arabinose efflux permease